MIKLSTETRHVAVDTSLVVILRVFSTFLEKTWTPTVMYRQKIQNHICLSMNALFQLKYVPKCSQTGLTIADILAPGQCWVCHFEIYSVCIP